MGRLLAWTVFVLGASAGFAAEYRPPAGNRPAIARPGAPSILPGGRAVAPVGKHYRTGPGSYGLAINPKGTTVVTASTGLDRYVLTAVSRSREGWHNDQHEPDETGERGKDRRIVSAGLAFEDDNDVYLSEGETGKVRLVDSRNGKVKQTYDLNQGDSEGAYAGDIAFDREAKRLYVLDQANGRLTIFDTGSKRLVSTVRVGRIPFAIALSADGKRAYVTTVGMFEYRPGPAPAFGFPSPAAMTALGDPNAAESNSVAIVDVTTPSKPELIKHVRTGRPFGAPILGGSSPSGVFATGDRVYVSNTNNDSVTVIDATSLQAVAEIGLRFAGLEGYRGITPIGLHYDAASKWLLVACAGINAVAVIDVEKQKILGLIPTAWFPTRLAIKDGMVWVNCSKGFGTGPAASRTGLSPTVSRIERRQGALMSFPLPDEAELQRHSGTVFAANGLVSRTEPSAGLPEAIEHVVVIMKENRTYDEVLGDIESATNGAVAGLPILARYGRFGVVNNRRGEFQTRLGLRGINVTPNHHALAQRFAFSDNFYADSEQGSDGRRWFVGAYPNAWGLLNGGERAALYPEQQPEAGLLWHHLERHGVSFRNFGEGVTRIPGHIPLPEPLYRNTSPHYPGFDMNTPDQLRASRFIEELDESYAKSGTALPRFLFVHLPNDHAAAPRPDDGYPFAGSFVADNDLALGRIVEYLSGSPWWPKMAIFVTEDDTLGGLDHIDSHRTLLLAISPYAKRNYVSHVNSSYAGLLKTVLRLLRLPPLNLFDVTAADLADCFQTEADVESYKALAAPPEVFAGKSPESVNSR